MMFTEVDVFIGNNTLIDPDIYHYWLEGFTGNVDKSLLNLLSVL